MGLAQPLVVSYGLGVDSTAALLGLRRRGIRPDLILFADTGNERHEVYQYLPTMQQWLQSVKFPPVTVVRYIPQDFSHYPPYTSLGSNCLTNGTLPSLAFGFKSCSLKWKVAPQNKFCDHWQPAIDCWAAGGKVRKIIGYDAGAKDRKRYAQAVGVEDPKYDYWYPLIDWKWDRERCIKEIVAEGLPGWSDWSGTKWVERGGQPVKSACYFCPATQPEELHHFKKIYLQYIVIMEARAMPRLEGHIPQEELDRQYAVAVKKWEQKCEKARHEAAQRSHRLGRTVSPALPKKPRHPQQATGVLGLWRRGRKGTRGGKKMPGMMTDYIREHNLLPQAEIDHLIATAPQAIIDNQEAFENGAEIPEWHDFIEAFSEEDMGQQMPKLELAMRTVCDGCECSCVC